jgi:hypothetical protein
MVITFGSFSGGAIGGGAIGGGAIGGGGRWPAAPAGGGAGCRMPDQVFGSSAGRSSRPVTTVVGFR